MKLKEGMIVLPNIKEIIKENNKKKRLQKKIEDLRNDKKGIESDIRAAKKEHHRLSALSEDAMNDKKVLKVEEEIEELKRLNREVKEKITLCTTEIDRIETKIAEMKTSGVKLIIDQLKADRKDMSERLKDAREDVSRFKSRLAAIDRDLEELGAATYR